MTEPSAEAWGPAPIARRLSPEEAVDAIALLDEPRRRALYELVTARAEPMGRDEAARALGIGRELAAFHLDRLAAAGLLDVEFRRLGGRTGPGAGRPAKLYKRSKNEVAVSLPARDYERAAEVFAAALDQLEEPARGIAVETIDDVARTRGREAGAGARRRAGGRADAAPVPDRLGAHLLREALVETLGGTGYEPTTEAPTASGPGAIRLQNCPYHALSANHRDLTCGMNLAWAEGVLDGLGDAGLSANLAPEPGFCCVVFREDHPA